MKLLLPKMTYNTHQSQPSMRLYRSSITILFIFLSAAQLYSVHGFHTNSPTFLTSSWRGIHHNRHHHHEAEKSKFRNGNPQDCDQIQSYRCRSLFVPTSSSLSQSKLTDWVVENLESNEDESSNSCDIGKITSSSETKAGENDTLPQGGLYIGRFRVLPAGAVIGNEKASLDNTSSSNDASVFPIKLLVGRNGWGTGVHPTTKLCLEWLCRPDIVKGGETILDYGCGSGILSIGALGLGAASALGVDVEAEALVTCERNLELNDFGDRFEGFHTREIIPYCFRRPTGVDICIANILVGQLVRPSMVSAIVTNLAPGAWLCLSGIRPGGEVESLKAAYGKYVDWVDTHYGELAASDTEGSIDSYGFDVGSWSRLVGRLKVDEVMNVEAMSELAVS